MTTITLATLRKAGACADQVRLFAETFPDGTPADYEAALATALAHASAFDWDWAAEHLLSAPAQAEYERVTAGALAEYERVTAGAFVAALFNRKD